MRKITALTLIQLTFLAACGGGGGYGGGGGGGPPPPSQNIATPGPPNVESITVDAGASGTSVNLAYLSVKVCVPGTMTCQTIDHIEVDTGSTGLRLLYGALSSQINGNALPQEPGSTAGTFLTECLQFADGSSYGSLRFADITLPVSGKTASHVVVQIIGDPNYPVPNGSVTGQSRCPGVPENTVAAFGANGILGVGPFVQDCGGGCVAPLPPPPGMYYSCTATTTCADSNATLAQQVANPATLFSSDNNGVIVELPAVGSAGATTVPGSLVFGIGTQSNNGLGSATVLREDTITGFITATYKGTTYQRGFIDSGSNGNFFTDSSIPACPSPNQGFYCPSSTLMESVTLQGTNAAMVTPSFSVANANSLFAITSYTAFSNLAGSNPDATAFDFGLPFFYGHNVYTAFENANAGGNMGPYFAF